jgi:tripartite-type tricarboxylate transporter receptor subunit TctC
MRVPMRAYGLLLFAGAIPLAQAQDFPVKTIRVIVPAAAGGSPDVLARLLGSKLHERLGQPVVVDNRAGAGQMIGADAVAKSPPDGHTLLLPTITYTTSAAIQPKLPFDPLKDLTGITMIGEGAFLVVVHPSLPVKSIKQLIALAKAKPGEINYGSSTGTIAHLITEMLMARVGIRMTQIPYKSAAPSVMAAVGGHVSLVVLSLPSVLPQVKAGRLRAIAVTSAQRSPFVPDLPTVAESGVPGYEARQWWGLFAPGSTPRPVIDKINTEIRAILATDEIKARLATEGAQPVLTMMPDEFNVIVRSDIERWRRLVTELNLKFN